MNQALSYMLKKNYYKIAVIPGDGIGNEVMPEAIRVLEKIGERYNISFDFDQKDWSCERYHKFGSMMPEDGLDEIQNHDSILLGALAAAKL
ncbi:MAG: isocitrate/isopropylmalate family dehydrogenase, partial [Nitrospinales bacterium]|nr:isocitrate/isopropylmalate family dehydrogenase [Nitrospinales bacterium]